MISREAADALAQSLLEPAYDELRERRNARVRYGLLFYRFPELRQFEPWQRDAITRRCATLVNQEPLTFVLFSLWIVFVVATIDFLKERFLGDNAGLAIVAIGWLLILLHGVRLRQHVRAFVDFVARRKGPSANAG